MCLLAFYSVYRCVKTRGAKGVSIQSFVAFAVGRTLHTSSHLIGVHYNPTSLPYALYLSVDFANVLLGLLASLQLYLRSQPGDFDADVTGWFLLKKLVPRRFENALWVKHGGLPFASLFLAFLWSLFRYDEEAQTRGPVMFFACACCEICQLMAVLPQLHILHVQRRIPALLGDFLMLQGVGKLCLLGFWVLFPALHGWTPSNWLVATCTEFFNIMILLDFMVFYLRDRGRIDVERACDVAREHSGYDPSFFSAVENDNENEGAFPIAEKKVLPPPADWYRPTAPVLLSVSGDEEDGLTGVLTTAKSSFVLEQDESRPEMEIEPAPPAATSAKANKSGSTTSRRKQISNFVSKRLSARPMQTPGQPTQGDGEGCTTNLMKKQSSEEEDFGLGPDEELTSRSGKKRKNRKMHMLKSLAFLGKAKRKTQTKEEREKQKQLWAEMTAKRLKEGNPNKVLDYYWLKPLVDALSADPLTVELVENRKLKRSYSLLPPLREREKNDHNVLQQTGREGTAGAVEEIQNQIPLDLVEGVEPCSGVFLQKGFAPNTFPLFLFAGACPSAVTRNMQAILFVYTFPPKRRASRFLGGGGQRGEKAAALKKDSPGLPGGGTIDFWWVKPEAGGRKLDYNYLQKHESGRWKNVCGSQTRGGYEQIADYFRKNAMKGPDAVPGIPIVLRNDFESVPFSGCFEEDGVDKIKAMCAGVEWKTAPGGGQLGFGKYNTM
eukprot:g9206.t1